MVKRPIVRATGMEGIVVSTQAVQRCLDREGLLLDDGIRCPLWQSVGSGSRPAIGTLSRATKAARPSYEDRRLVFEDDLSRVLILGHHARSNSGSLALVEDLNNLCFVDERSTCGDRAFDL